MEDRVPEEEVEVDYFRFVKEGRLQLCDPTEDGAAHAKDLPQSLIASSNEYGIVVTALGSQITWMRLSQFRANARKFRSASDISQNPTPQPRADEVRRIKLQGVVSFLTLSSSGKTLAVLYRSTTASKPASANHLALYDVAALCKGLDDRDFDVDPILDESVADAHPGYISVQFSAADESDETLLVLTADGNVYLMTLPSMEIKVRLYESDRDPAKSAVLMPAAKLAAIGTGSGAIHAVDMASGKVALRVPAIESGWDVGHLAALSSHAVIASYNREADTSLIVYEMKAKSVSSTVLGELCFPLGSNEDEETRSFVHIEGIPGWNACVVGSSASTNIELVVLDPEREKWLHYRLDDEWSASLPMTEDYEDTFPLGIVLDLTNTEPVPANDPAEDPLLPMPRILVFTTEGLVLPLAVVDDRPGATCPAVKAPLPPPPLRFKMLKRTSNAPKTQFGATAEPECPKIPEKTESRASSQGPVDSGKTAATESVSATSGPTVLGKTATPAAFSAASGSSFTPPGESKPPEKRFSFPATTVDANAPAGGSSEEASSGLRAQFAGNSFGSGSMTFTHTASEDSSPSTTATSRPQKTATGFQFSREEASTQRLKTAFSPVPSPERAPPPASFSSERPSWSQNVPKPVPSPEAVPPPASFGSERPLWSQGVAKKPPHTIHRSAYGAQNAFTVGPDSLGREPPEGELEQIAALIDETESDLHNMRKLAADAKQVTIGAAQDAKEDTQSFNDRLQKVVESVKSMRKREKGLNTLLKDLVGSIVEIDRRIEEGEFYYRSSSDGLDRPLGSEEAERDQKLRAIDAEVKKSIRDVESALESRRRELTGSVDVDVHTNPARTVQAIFSALSLQGIRLRRIQALQTSMKAELDTYIEILHSSQVSALTERMARNRITTPVGDSDGRRVDVGHDISMEKASPGGWEPTSTPALQRVLQSIAMRRGRERITLTGTLPAEEVDRRQDVKQASAASARWKVPSMKQENVQNADARSQSRFMRAQSASSFREVPLGSAKQAMASLFRGPAPTSSAVSSHASDIGEEEGEDFDEDDDIEEVDTTTLRPGMGPPRGIDEMMSMIGSMFPFSGMRVVPMESIMNLSPGFAEANLAADFADESTSPFGKRPPRSAPGGRATSTWAASSADAEDTDMPRFTRDLFSQSSSTGAASSMGVPPPATFGVPPTASFGAATKPADAADSRSTKAGGSSPSTASGVNFGPPKASPFAFSSGGPTTSFGAFGKPEFGASGGKAEKVSFGAPTPTANKNADVNATKTEGAHTATMPASGTQRVVPEAKLPPSGSEKVVPRPEVTSKGAAKPVAAGSTAFKAPVAAMPPLGSEKDVHERPSSAKTQSQDDVRRPPVASMPPVGSEKDVHRPPVAAMPPLGSEKDVHKKPPLAAMPPLGSEKDVHNKPPVAATPPLGSEKDVHKKTPVATMPPLGSEKDVHKEVPVASMPPLGSEQDVHKKPPVATMPPQGSEKDVHKPPVAAMPPLGSEKDVHKAPARSPAMESKAPASSDANVSNTSHKDATTNAPGAPSPVQFGSTAPASAAGSASSLFGSGAAFGSGSSSTVGANTTSGFGSSSGTAFGASSGSAFGASSGSAFGASGGGFGASSQPSFGSGSSNAFGASSGAAAGTGFAGSSSSAFGASSGSAFGTGFGASSGSGLSSSSIFGKSQPFSNTGSATGFGSPSNNPFESGLSGGERLGAASSSANLFGNSPFGASASSASTGQLAGIQGLASGFDGMSTGMTTPFGGQPQSSSPFSTGFSSASTGMGGTLQSTPSAFGSGSGTGTLGGAAFGAPTPFGTQTAAAFGGGTTIGSAFGSPSAVGLGVTAATTFSSPGSSFGKPTLFGGASPQGGGFASLAQQSQTASGFGIASNTGFGALASQQTGFGKSSGFNYSAQTDSAFTQRRL